MAWKFEDSLVGQIMTVTSQEETVIAYEIDFFM